MLGKGSVNLDDRRSWRRGLCFEDYGLLPAFKPRSFVLKAEGRTLTGDVDGRPSIRSSVASLSKHGRVWTHLGRRDLVRDT